MPRALLFLVLFAGAGACRGAGGPQGSSAPSESSAPSAESKPSKAELAVPPPSATGESAAAAPTGPLPYPETSIAKARDDNRQLSCQELVYKRGCAEVRTGHVRVRISLGPKGQVERVEILENGIRRDPETVATCLTKKLPSWSFAAPDGVSPSFEMDFGFSDKC